MDKQFLKTVEVMQESQNKFREIRSLTQSGENIRPSIKKRPAQCPAEEGLHKYCPVSEAGYIFIHYSLSNCALLIASLCFNYLYKVRIVIPAPQFQNSRIQGWNC